MTHFVVFREVQKSFHRLCYIIWLHYVWH